MMNYIVNAESDAPNEVGGCINAKSDLKSYFCDFC